MSARDGNGWPGLRFISPPAEPDSRGQCHNGPDRQDVGDRCPGNSGAPTGTKSAPHKLGRWNYRQTVLGAAWALIQPPGAGSDEPVYIYNFLLRPDGRTGRDMEAVWAAGRNGQSRFFGAGQMQVLFYGDMTEAEREATFEKFVLACEPAVAQILDGYEAE